jgi:hypothetical protein
MSQRTSSAPSPEPSSSVSGHVTLWSPAVVLSAPPPTSATSSPPFAPEGRSRLGRSIPLDINATISNRWQTVLLTVSDDPVMVPTKVPLTVIVSVGDRLQSVPERHTTIYPSVSNRLKTVPRASVKESVRDRVVEERGKA